jgi:hypothetical protein
MACGSDSGSSEAASTTGGSGGELAGGGSGVTTGGSIGVGGATSTPVSPFIVVDQFGYLPDSEKIAVIRDPQAGFDAGESFTPGGTYALVDAAGSMEVFTGTPVAWNGGATDSSSGDRAWWFDFSSVSTPGSYYVLDLGNGVRSHVFDISTAVYQQVLKQAVRMFFYQRAGQAKQPPYADPAWADTASHVGPLQDHDCRLYSQPSDAATARDLWGGWYDAGDQNKYTSWTAGYVMALLQAYDENPSVWTDDYAIPESGNGVPDILDEAKWGLDFLTRMQNADGSVLSIVGLSNASPPSSATGQSLYGSANTSATLSTAGAFAYGAHVLGGVGQSAYAADLESRAISAWNWADANPNVLFYNNDGSYGTSGLGAGQQETDDYGRLVRKLAAAVFLYEITGDTTYRSFFDANYTQVHLAQWWWAGPFEFEGQEVLLSYTTVAGATASVVSAIQGYYQTGMGSYWELHSPAADPYLAQLQDYTWGSNSVKCNQGLMFQDVITYGTDAARNADARRAAERYVHYIHGVNPLGLVYLTNMNAFGAESSANEIFHSWFADGSSQWDRVGTSAHGPAPGFMPGGPNPSYQLNSCCPNDCAGLSCSSEPIEPPLNQPAQKSYKDFNTGWPFDSWSVTEPSDGYQVKYIRLLSWFVQ